MIEIEDKKYEKLLDILEHGLTCPDNEGLPGLNPRCEIYDDCRECWSSYIKEKDPE